MKDNSSDVIVVGGGPCGSFTALHLAKLGADVKVFEEHAEIGVPCHCAGHLSVKGLKLLGLYPLPSEIVENTFYGAVFHSPKGNQFRIRFSSPITCVVNRMLFDKYLAETAKDNGVKCFLDSRVESLIIENGLVTGVVAKREGAKKRFSAKVVVDAEGISSALLRQVDLSASDHRVLVKAVQVEVENVQDVDADMVEVFLGRDYAPGFYAWLMPTQDGKARVGLAADIGNPKELLRRLMLKHPTASKKLCRAKILQTSFHSIPLGGPIPKTFSDGFLVVGDAASQVKPTTGGGVIFGMTCAKVVAKVAYEALEKKDFSSDFLRIYQRRCNKKLGSEIRFMLEMRKMLDNLSDDQLDDAISFCTKIGLEKALQNFEDIDFQGRSFLHVLWNPRVPLALFHFLFLYLFANR